jgi:N-glycosylase/DNA lyase
MKGGPGTIRGLMHHPLSVRARPIVASAENALLTRYEHYTELDLWFSDIRYLAWNGRVQQVSNRVELKHTLRFASYSIVPAPKEKWPEIARSYRENLLAWVLGAYGSAIRRHAWSDLSRSARKNRTRRYKEHFRELDRNRAPEDIDAYFSDYPEAVEYASEIKQLYRRIERRMSAFRD